VVEFAFYSIAAITLISALGVVTLRNVLHSALLLGLSVAGVAGLFATMGADFVFAAQILIYVTGIAVLVLFVVMLAGRASDLRLRQVNKQWFPALLVCTVIFWGIWRFASVFKAARGAASAQPTTAAIGRLLLSDLAVPFELISVILVVALVGAVVFSKRALR